MAVFGYFLIVVANTLAAFGQPQDAPQTKAALISQFQASINSFDTQIAQLKNGQTQLRSLVTQNKGNCTAEIAELRRKNEEAVKLQSEKVQKLYRLKEALANEEAIHVQLIEEMKKLTNLLELLHLQNTILDEDLQLFMRRRSKGTLGRCKDVSSELKNVGQLVEVRSGLKKNPFKLRPSLDQEDLKLKLVTANFNRKSAMSAKFTADIASLKAELEIEAESCATQKSNYVTVLEETMIGLETSLQSESLVQNELNDSRAKTEEIRLQLETGKNFVVELLKRAQKIRAVIKKNYKCDAECYTLIYESA